MISLLLPRLLFALVLATPLAGCLDKSPAQRIEAARQALQKHDAKAAIVELKSALQKESGNAEARLLLGEAFLTARQYPSSETELRKAMQLGAPADQVLPDLARCLVKQGKFQDVVDLALPKSGLGSQALASVWAGKADAYLGLNQPVRAAAAIGEGEKALAAVGGDAYSTDLYLAKAQIALVNHQPDQSAAMLDLALQRDAKSIDTLYMKARLLLATGKTTQALAVYQKLVATKPDDLPGHLAIFAIKLRDNDLAAAEQALHAAEVVDAKNTLVRYARGSLELRLGNLEKASSTLTEVLRVSPHHLPSVLAYAMASYGLGHYDQSLKNAGIVLGADPENLIATEILVSSQMKVGDLNSALKSLSLPLTKHPDDAKLLALAGEAYLQAKEYNKAMIYLDRAAALDPKNAITKTAQATSHLAMGNTSEAVVELQTAAGLSGKLGKADLALVMLHMQNGQYDQALQAIAGLEKKESNSPVTLNLRGSALLGKQNRVGARKAFEQALAIQPGFFPAAIHLARMDILEHRPEDARKRFESILAADKENVNAMLALAELSSVKENDAIAWLEKAAKTDPKALPAHEGLIRHYLARKENAKALAQARQASNANPESLPALNLLGATQLRTGDHDASISTYTRLTQLAPRTPGAYRLLAGAQIAGKQLAAARNSLNTALRLKPDFLDAQDALIQLDLIDNQPDAALAVARHIQNRPLGFDREADIQLALKHYPQAVKAYQEALVKGAGTASLIKLHRALLAAGDHQAADRQLSGWIKQHPKDQVAKNYAAVIYMLANRNREAIALYEERLGATPRDVVALNNLAALYQREKDPRAQITAEQAYKLAPNLPGVEDTLGWILVGQGQLPRALDLLNMALVNAPRDATIRYHRGVALALSGKKAEAKQDLVAAIADAQAFPDLENARALLKSL